MSRYPLANFTRRLEKLAADARDQGKPEDAKVFEEGAAAIKIVSLKLAAVARLRGKRKDAELFEAGAVAIETIPRRSLWERLLRMLASRWVGTSIAVLGIGATGVAICNYWPAVTAKTIKTSILVSLFVGEEVTSKFAGKELLLALLAAWAIVPSGWFLLEWAYGSPHADPVPEDDTALKVRNQAIEEFKYMQSLSRAIWVAVLAVLAVLFGVSVTGPGAP